MRTPMPAPTLAITVARGFWARLRGWMFRRSVADGESLLLMHCNSVHTCWMRFAIDVVFLDADGRVMRVRRDVRPFRAVWLRGAAHVLEIASSGAQRHGLSKGQQVSLPHPVARRS